MGLWEMKSLELKVTWQEWVGWGGDRCPWLCSSPPGTGMSCLFSTSVTPSALWFEYLVFSPQTLARSSSLFPRSLVCFSSTRQSGMVLLAHKQVINQSREPFESCGWDRNQIPLQ